MGLRPMVFLCLFLAACQAAPSRPLPLAANVDLARFMGDWYVIAATPTFIDGEAHNAIESYRLASDGTIETTYKFREGAPGGPLRSYHPRATVRNGTGNAAWSMQFVWPFKADYRIGYLADDYSQVIVAREKRDYAWIMARTPHIPEADYRRLVLWLVDAGYDPAQLRRIPQGNP
jgi:apolipoprotein D and lipocalin family protein